jgi:hypothetical protein
MDFNRIESTIDVERMQRSHVSFIGGAYGLARDLVRCGLGAVTLMDYDRVAASNPARQDLYLSDLGRYKTEATAADLRRINPTVEVEVHPRDFCELTRDEIDALFGHTDQFIYATDFFPAQARGNLEALRLGKSAVWIGMYQGGRAGEIVYHVPGVTPACYRCICGTRYEAFASGGATVSSHGGTVLDLHLVDAVAGQIAVGILTRGAPNRMGGLIDKLGDRNLLQIKIDPDYTLGEKDIFWHYLGDHPANFSFTTIAIPMEREDGCPDCGHLHVRECEPCSESSSDS